ncbi:hypothetical protein ACJJTC_013559 [Scirpophaga incertulas]
MASGLIPFAFVLASGIINIMPNEVIIHRKLHYSPKVAAKIVNACCVLHNIAHRTHVPYKPLTAEEAAQEREFTEGASRPTQQTDRRRSLSDLQLGHARRLALIRRLWADRTIN